MTYAAPERFDIARVLSRMFGVIARNLPVFAGLAVLLSGLPSLTAALVERGVGFPFDYGPWDHSGLGWIVGILVSTLLQGALINATISDLSGRPVTLGDCLGTATRNVLPLIGIGVATTVAVVFGLVLFIVPGVILALALCVSGPAQVVEGHGVFAALSRSSDLTRGHRGAILLLFVMFAIGSAILRSFAEILPLTTAIAAPDAAHAIRDLVVTPLLQALGAMFGAAGVASIYFELRTIKEGVGIEALAKAFE